MRHLLSRHRRRLLLALFAAAMFLLWFGVWVRVLGIRPRVVIKSAEPIGLIGYTPDGNALLTITAYPSPELGNLQLWEAATGRELRNYSRDETMLLLDKDLNWVLVDKSQTTGLCQEIGPPGKRVATYRLSPDGKTLAIRGGKNQVWDVATDRPRYELEARADFLLGFSPDGTTLIYDRPGSGCRELVLCDMQSGERTGVLSPCCGFPWPVRFSPDGLLVAAGYCNLSVDGERDEIKVWSVKTQGELVVIDGAKNFVFSSEGRSLAAVIDPYHDTSVKVWDTSSWTVRSEISPLPEHSGEASIRFVPSTSLLIGYECLQKHDGLPEWLSSLVNRSEQRNQIAKSKKLRFVDTESGCRYGPVSGDFANARLSPDGRTLALRPDEPDTEIHLYDLPPRRPIALYLLFSALPTLVFTGVLWWRVR